MADVSLEAQRIDGRAGARRSGKMATSAGENAEPAGKVTVRFVREVRRTRALSFTASLTRVRMTSFRTIAFLTLEFSPHARRARRMPGAHFAARSFPLGVDTSSPLPL